MIGLPLDDARQRRVIASVEDYIGGKFSDIHGRACIHTSLCVQTALKVEGIHSQIEVGQLAIIENQKVRPGEGGIIAVGGHHHQGSFHSWVHTCHDDLVDITTATLCDLPNDGISTHQIPYVWWRGAGSHKWPIPFAFLYRPHDRRALDQLIDKDGAQSLTRDFERFYRDYPQKPRPLRTWICRNTEDLNSAYEQRDPWVRASCALNAGFEVLPSHFTA